MYVVYTALLTAAAVVCLTLYVMCPTEAIKKILGILRVGV